MLLSRKDADFLQEAIVRYGRIVTFKQLMHVFDGRYSRAQIRNRLSQLAKSGWLLRLKKGLYIIITDIGNLGSHDISLFSLAQALNKDSYISFENALQHHGMFDQMLSNITAITFKRARKYKLKGSEIKYFKIKKLLFFGFARERSDINLVNIAEKEKALLDILYFNSSSYYISLIWEKLREHKEDLNFAILHQYAIKYGNAMVRKIGFLLDQLNIRTDDLLKIIKGDSSYAKLTKESKIFNAKWRLYFDPKLIE